MNYTVRIKYYNGDEETVQFPSEREARKYAKGIAEGKLHGDIAERTVASIGTLVRGRGVSIADNALDKELNLALLDRQFQGDIRLTLRVWP